MLNESHTIADGFLSVKRSLQSDAVWPKYVQGSDDIIYADLRGLPKEEVERQGKHLPNFVADFEGTEFYKLNYGESRFSRNFSPREPVAETAKAKENRTYELQYQSHLGLDGRYYHVVRKSDNRTVGGVNIRCYNHGYEASLTVTTDTPTLLNTIHADGSHETLLKAHKAVTALANSPRGKKLLAKANV